jgi:hypothetical protein
VVSHYKATVQKALKNAGKTNRDLARYLGVPESVASRMVDPDHPRKVTVDELIKIGTFLGFEVPIPPLKAVAPPGPEWQVILAPVLGTAAEEVWRDPTPSSYERRIPIIPHHGFEPRRQYVVLGTGRVGEDYFICLPIDALKRDLEDGDLVHLEEQRSGLVRTLVRGVRVYSDAKPEFFQLTQGHGAKTRFLKQHKVVGIVLSYHVTYRIDGHARPTKSANLSPG